MKRLLILLIILNCCIVYPLLASAETRIKVLAVQGDIINPVTAEYIERGLKEARDDQAIVIIKIDTPGGLLKSTERIVKLLLNSPQPVVTFIYPKGGRAASAGVFIGYASHILAMSPSTRIGAAHPVIGGGKWGSLDEESKKKILNDMVAWAENISQARDKPFRFLKEAIEESTSISEKEALRRKVCDVVAEDLKELIRFLDKKEITTASGTKKISAKNVSIEKINPTGREKFLNALIEPNIAYILLTLGFLGLLFEVTHPGFGFPGIAGVICLILSFYAFSILPTNYAGLTLIALGLIFFIVEAFTPTFGMFTLGGIAGFILGSVMLFTQPKFFKIPLTTILPTAFFMAALSIFFVAKTVMAHRKKPSTGAGGLVGKTGIAQTDIFGQGKVFIHGELWDAKSDSHIDKGREVAVTGLEGLKLFVKETRPAGNGANRKEEL